MLTADQTTNGERLLIERRRRDETQAHAAKRHRVSLYQFTRWEMDEGSPPKVAIGRLAFHEAALLLRRRDGVSVKERAKAIGVTPWWLSQMEAGAVALDRLEAFFASKRTRKAARSRSKRSA